MDNHTTNSNPMGTDADVHTPQEGEGKGTSQPAPEGNEGGEEKGEGENNA